MITFYLSDLYTHNPFTAMNAKTQVLNIVFYQLMSLMLDVLENCNLPLPAFQNSMKALREEYPIISAMQVRDRDGNYLALEDCEEGLKEYHSLAYYLLFDSEGTNCGENR